MINQDEINACLALAIQQRTSSEIIATMGTKVLTLQNFQSLIRKYNRNVLNKTIEEYYMKIIQENNSTCGITLEIFQKLIDTMPQPKQRTDIVINMVEKIQQKKVSLERIFDFFDRNTIGVLKRDELRELFEYIYPKITEQEIRTLLKNNQQVQFTLQDLKTLLSYGQNSNAEIVIVKDEDQEESNDESQQIDEVLDEDDEFEKFRYLETSAHFQEYQKFRKFYMELKERKQKFSDSKFPPNHESLGQLCEPFEWKRLTDVWKKADVFKADLYHFMCDPGVHSLVSPRDIKQGYLADCYFLSSLASIAKKHPQLIADLFLTQETNPYCIYGVWLCLFGHWQIIILDDYVPFYKNEPAFCGSDFQENKAWAKVFGSYSNIIYGDPREVIASITGGPTWCLSTEDKNFNTKLEPLVDSTYIICAGTYSENQDYETVGLQANHAYSVLNFRTIKLPNQTEVQLIKLKNPYGNEMEWKGDWSDHSSLWTQELKDNVLKHQENDGIFYMSLPDFRKYFESVFVGFCSPYYKQSQVLVNCQKRKASYILITIKKDIEIYFSAYQKSKRLFQKSNQYQEYQYSNIRMILCKMQKNNTITHVTSAQEADMSFHIGGRLQKGSYILQIKADWVLEGWDTSDVALVGYGEDDPEMKFCQKIPKFQSALILQEVKDQRESLLQNNQTLKTTPVNANTPNLVYLRDKSKAFLGISYLYYQNISKDKIYSFRLKLEGLIKIRKPFNDGQIDIELKPGQEKIVCYKYIGKGTMIFKMAIEDLVVNELV